MSISRLYTLLSLTGLLLLALSTISIPAQADFNTEQLEGLEWRLIGPWRGGRSTTATGVKGKPLLYYMGTTGGGVWKTENAGVTWENLSDNDFKVGTIGAVAVSESDNNVLYVGTGEAPIRGVTTSSGDGVWKSTDAGKTWKHIGLEKSGQISSIRIHPTNSDIAWVAVQGQIWGPNEDRGVFRTQDGGKTWEHVLKVSADAGASDLRLDPTNPRILYAALWHHGRKPWYIQSGGTDGGIYKSIDSGDNWEKLKGGLPEMVGKIAVDVSASNPQRIYALLEAEPGEGGLWRSEDAGENWALINGHRVLHTRAWYYIHIAADPVDDETVYVLNVPLMKSVDGGTSWTKMSTPHSDHHDHWINPDNNRNIISANDGGATITFDGGDTWSSIMNQPTAQFYRVTTDNLTPFTIYGGQQDNTTVAIASESLYGSIGVADYFDVGGGESAHVAFDPDNPRLIYATTINGTLTEYDHKTKYTRAIIPYPELVYGKDSKDLKYRTNWNAPVIVSPHDPAIIYYGTQLLLKSDDRGVSWTEISPDLTRNDPAKQGRNGGPLTPENVGAEFYNTVFYIVESQHEEGIIWVGSDDGLIHITRDGGGNWTNVSPKHKGEAMINSIEISPHDPATAYVAVTGYKLNDNKPYIYKTSDYGKRWKRLDSGLPKDSFVRVVREDPTMKGVLYAGTETGLFVSHNDGKNWQSMRLNLPPVPITDLTIRQDKLVVATQGRAFWVLDDLFVIRQAASDFDAKQLQVFVPKSAAAIQNSGYDEDFEGANPTSGAAIYYYLPSDSGETVTIDILSESGGVIRSYSSDESNFDRCTVDNMDPRLPFELEHPSTDKGLNLWYWNLNRENLNCVDDLKLFAGFDGPSVAPGQYKVRISQAGKTQAATFAVTLDPRIKATSAEVEDWSSRLQEMAGMMNDTLTLLDQARTAKHQAKALMDDYPQDSAIQKSGDSVVKQITEWDGKLNQVLHQTYEDEDAWETMLVGQMRYLMDVIDSTGAPVTSGAAIRLSDLKTELEQRKQELDRIKNSSIQTINQRARELVVPYVAPPGN